MNGPRLRRKSEHRPVLITGGCGFIGCNLSHVLAERGGKVLVLDNLARDGARENARWLKGRHGNRVEIRRGDVREADIVRGAVAEASAVLHLAGQVAVTTSLDHPIEDFDINAHGTLRILEAVRMQNPEIPVLFASTNKVYGKALAQHQVRLDGSRYVPVDPAYRSGVRENAPLDFHSPYGCSKGAADQYVHDYARVFGLRTVVMRMSCIYGPRQFGTEDQGWIAHFFLQAIRREGITIYGDGYQVRDALHVDDAVAAWVEALDRIDVARGKVFNLGGGAANSVSLRELLEIMSDMNRQPVAVHYSGWRPGDQPWYVSDTAHLQRTLGWSPRISLRRGLESLDDWLGARFGARSESAGLAEAHP